MGWYARHVLPRVVDRVCSTPLLVEWRRRNLAGISGRVLEIGFGSGTNLPHYPAGVTEVLAVEPSTTARTLAAARLAAAPFPVAFVELDGDRIDVPDDAVDHAVTSFVLCTVPDVVAALGELRRILRPDGALHVLEHGRADDARVRRWQRRLNPAQRRLGGGCHLDRPIGELVRAAGFAVADEERGIVGGPIGGSLYRLRAR